MTPSFIATHDRTHADYQQQWDTLIPKGYRPISISVYGQRSNPLYAAVWVQQPGSAFALKSSAAAYLCCYAASIPRTISSSIFTPQSSEREILPGIAPPVPDYTGLIPHCPNPAVVDAPVTIMYPTRALLN